MENLFVPYNIALELYNLGFDEDCFGHYENIHSTNGEHYLVIWNEDGNDMLGFINDNYKSKDFIKAPTYQQVTDWFRKIHNIFCSINISLDGFYYRMFKYHNECFENEKLLEYNLIFHQYVKDYKYPTYEEALYECIIEGLKCLNNK